MVTTSCLASPIITLPLVLYSIGIKQPWWAVPTLGIPPDTHVYFILPNIAMILPLRAIVFQMFFLLGSIAIESFVMHKRIKLNRKTCMEYAASLNLFVMVAGWLCFFMFVKTMPEDMTTDMINFMLFNNSDRGSWGLIVFAGICTFIISYGIKLKGWEILERLRDEILFETPMNAKEISEEEANRMHDIKTQFIKNPSFYTAGRIRAKSLMEAHGSSHSTLVIVLIVKSLLEGQM